MTTLLWFTDDLRLSDHSALAAACMLGEPIIPVYLHNPQNPHLAQGASRWWLHHSLKALGENIRAQHGELCILEGDINALMQMALKNNCQTLYFSCSHEPWLASEQKKLHTAAQQHNINCRQFGGQVLIEPSRVLNGQGKPFQVFTPYYRQVLKQLFIPKKHNDISNIPWSAAKNQPRKVTLEKSLHIINGQPHKPDWAKAFNTYWQPGEVGAQAQLDKVIGTLNHYSTQRDIPSLDGTSCLSPHLHFGEISPRSVWQQLTAFWPEEDIAPFLRQLIWREFNTYLLHHYPYIKNAPFKESFKHFPWSIAQPEQLKLWQQGQTGYPIVDAGMRQLWQTGWMHNRVRMVVASFLTKHLRMHWRHGADWFWDTLVDADVANNIAGWQWVAGCGADAAPYFRIFNPVLQGEKFDKNGDYIRRYIPELAKLPDKYIHTPWLAPSSVLSSANIELGKTYPKPMVDHQTARAQALEAYAQMRAIQIP
ncbi:MAG: deoxyribodipyrimidine photo-lyase [Marinagarivorans sp.]|nr:deoxyribodipyrimidine photo-lyase [Marinagarivorans sp.]